MTVPVPPSLPPVELHDRILAALLPRLHQPTSSALRPALQILAYRSLRQPNHSHSTPTKPLQLALRLSSSSSGADELDAGLLVDVIWAYPNHGNAISTILTRRFDALPTLLEEFGTVLLPSLVDALRTTKDQKDAGGSGSGSGATEIGVAVRALSTFLRAHDYILALGVMQLDTILSALQAVYGRLRGDQGLRMKEEVLLLVQRLANAMGDEEAFKRAMGPKDGGGGGRAFIDGTLRQDYEAVFEGGEISDEVMLKLKRFQDERASIGAVQNLISLFPYIPAEMLTSALTHPTYAGSPQPLVEAILAGGFNLPSELRELRALVAEHSEVETGFVPTATANTSSASGSGSKKPYERRNIWQDEKLDMSRLKIKDHSDEALASIGGAGIPNHLRDSIFRLVENQAVEAEEQERALAEARGDRDRPSRRDIDLDGEEEYVSRVRIVGEGDASGDEDVEGDADKVVDKTRRPAKEATYDPDLQIKLELAYLTNPAIYDRDAATRRSEGRIKLKDRTGMDDGQLEGWRVMLERNPHKDAILGRHQVIPQDYQIYLPKAGRGRGGGGGRGSQNGGGGGGGEGSGQDEPSGAGGSGRGGRGGGRGGGEGGRGGGGGGGGRGRGGSKGSRGHSNAARTRGHDKKMSRMGAV